MEFEGSEATILTKVKPRSLLRKTHINPTRSSEHSRDQVKKDLCRDIS